MTILEYIKYIDYNYIRGYEYEQYVCAMLHKFYDIDEVYLWKNVPYHLFIDASILTDHNAPKYDKQSLRFKFLIDTGIDLIARLKNNDILLVQCKCYQHRCISKTLYG